MLGENMSSRLFQVIREDRGLAYSIYSSLSYFDDVGTLTISAGLDLDNLTKTLEADHARVEATDRNAARRRGIAPRAGLRHRPD